jgi:hypothetical protein
VTSRRFSHGDHELESQTQHAVPSLQTHVLSNPDQERRCVEQRCDESLANSEPWWENSPKIEGAARTFYRVVCEWNDVAAVWDVTFSPDSMFISSIIYEDPISFSEPLMRASYMIAQSHQNNTIIDRLPTRKNPDSHCLSMTNSSQSSPDLGLPFMG